MYQEGKIHHGRLEDDLNARAGRREPLDWEEYSKVPQ